MFELLKEGFLKERQNKKQESKFYIENGYCDSWCENEKKASDNGLRRYSTETRWNQYTSGKIDREKAVALAVKRMEKAIDKEIAEKLAHLDRVAAAADITSIYVNVEYKHSSVWGYNPAVEVTTSHDTRVFTGYASGCGYNKESAAVARAFNSSPAILKVLYTLKENALAAGESDYSKTACTHVDNRDIVGYGAGYSVIPYFEGGVGVGCFWDILKKAGFTTRCNYGKHENLYRIYKED